MQGKPRPDEKQEFKHILYVVGMTDDTTPESNKNEPRAHRDSDQMEFGVEGRSVVKSIIDFK